MSERKGKILRLEKTSIHDGNGLRTVVFVKGCPLRCKWCSTPESQCMDCDDEYGFAATPEEIIREVCKDEVFFFHSGGGVTISGGEIMMQADFVMDILKGCLEQGISTAIESSLFGKYEELEKLLPYLNAVYVDFKLADDKKHQFYTGVSNVIIKDNIINLNAAFRGEIHVRIPIIPTVNMTVDNMQETAKFLKPLERVCDVELLPYHRLGMETYRKMGKAYELMDIETPTMDQMTAMANALRSVHPQCPVKIKGELFHEP